MVVNEEDATAVLVTAATFDRRTIGETDVRAWAIALGTLDPQRCREAVIRYYQENSRPVMPSDVRTLARTTTTGEYDRHTASHGPSAAQNPQPLPTTQPTFTRPVTGRLRDGTEFVYIKPVETRDPYTGSTDPRCWPFRCPHCGAAHGSSSCGSLTGPPDDFRDQRAYWRSFYRDQYDRDPVSEERS